MCCPASTINIMIIIWSCFIAKKVTSIMRISKHHTALKVHIDYDYINILKKNLQSELLHTSKAAALAVLWGRQE